MITFTPLWVTLAKRKMKKMDLYAVVSSATVARMGRDDYVSLDVIDKILDFLDCDITDVMAREPGPAQKEEKAPDE